MSLCNKQSFVIDYLHCRIKNEDKNGIWIKNKESFKMHHLKCEIQIGITVE